MARGSGEKKAKKVKAPLGPHEAVSAILAEPRVVWFPIKHYSAACAWHVKRVIEEVRPVGVLVEGPDDATALVPHIVAEDSWPPLAVLSTWVDKKNRFALNGVLSPEESIPARFRGWWPLPPYAPEYVALRTGHEVGAELAFIDAPLVATIPFDHARTEAATRVVNDRHLAENAYFEALRRKQRRRSFDEFWQANFEVGATAMSSEAFMRRVLTFAWCARNVVPPAVETGDGGASHDPFEVDGTLMREAHMRWCVDQFLKAHPEGRVVVVTGAFHSVALPAIKGKRAKDKADANTETVVTAHSYPALANLYEQSRLPNHASSVWESMLQGAEEPFNTAAMQLLIEIMRQARDASRVAVSTADVVGAYRVARNLSILRQNREVTLDDLLDAVQMTYVKGDLRIQGIDIELATRGVLVGQRVGRVTPEAGQIPLMRDFYVQARANKIDTSGAARNVRCDLHKHEGHRYKSAFLHQCDFLEIPTFGTRRRGAWDRGSHFSGPDPVTGENMHLITETWSVQWTESVDARLIELAERGATVAGAAQSLLVEKLEAARDDAAETTKLLLRTAQMLLVELFDEVLERVEDAISRDAAFEHLASALEDFVLLHSYRDAVATQGNARLLQTIVTLFGKCCLVLPQLANVQAPEVEEMLDRLQSLVRIALTFEAVSLDRELLVERLRLLVNDIDGSAAVRGAAFGILYSVGATREKVVARELDGYLLGSPERVLQAGAFLDGLFRTAKNIFIGNPRLMRAINRVLSQLDWQMFKTLLPDLRRAFTQFIPSEIDDISARVSEEIGLDDAPDPDLPVPASLAGWCAAADARVVAELGRWLEGGLG